MLDVSQPRVEARLPSLLIYHLQIWWTRENATPLRPKQQSFTVEEVRRLTSRLVAGRSLVCPRCGIPLDRTPVPPRRDVSYVRDRLWLVCPRCHHTAVLDRREGR